MTPAPTHFRDPPSEVSQLQKVGLHPLDSLSGKHSHGIFFSAFPTPSIIDPFCGLRILLGFFMMKEKVITESGICPCLSVSTDVGGNLFLLQKKKSSDLSKADFCLLLIPLITSQAKRLPQCCKGAEAQPWTSQRVSELSE